MFKSTGNKLEWFSFKKILIDLATNFLFLFVYSSIWTLTLESLCVWIILIHFICFLLIWFLENKTKKKPESMRIDHSFCRWFFNVYVHYLWITNIFIRIFIKKKFNFSALKIKLHSIFKKINHPDINWE